MHTRAASAQPLRIETLPALAPCGTRASDQKIRVLYLSYDGMLEPLGASQVLPYLRELSAQGVAFTLVSFEKPSDWAKRKRVQALQEILAAQGIRWRPLLYRRFTPVVLSSGMNFCIGLCRALAALPGDRWHIVHARSYVAGVMGWLLKRFFGVRFLFDLRGFWVDERVEGGLWPSSGLRYRLAKRLELTLLAEADALVTLTEASRRTLQEWPRLRTASITVIPTCVDLERFTAPPGKERAVRSPVFLYAGSVGTWYALEAMGAFVRRAGERLAGCRFIVLTRERRLAAEELRRVVGLDPEMIEIDSAAPADIPKRLTQVDAGLAFYRPGWSRQATCPTKVGEYLAMGLPVAVNAAVGDMRELIQEHRVGVVVSEFSNEAFDRALDDLAGLWADAELARRCRAVAESYFSLALGVERYRLIYERMAAPLMQERGEVFAASEPAATTAMKRKESALLFGAMSPAQAQTNASPESAEVSGGRRRSAKHTGLVREVP